MEPKKFSVLRSFFPHSGRIRLFATVAGKTDAASKPHAGPVDKRVAARRKEAAGEGTKRFQDGGRHGKGQTSDRPERRKRRAREGSWRESIGPGRSQGQRPDTPKCEIPERGKWKCGSVGARILGSSGVSGNKSRNTGRSNPQSQKDGMQEVSARWSEMLRAKRRCGMQPHRDARARKDLNTGSESPLRNAAAPGRGKSKGPECRERITVAECDRTGTRELERTGGPPRSALPRSRSARNQAGSQGISNTMRHPRR